MTYTVGDLASLARVSVRTLHHYDEIGLLRPSGRSGAGYRLYTAPDLQRLQQVLFFRELGFKLDEILRILSDPGFDRRQTLVAQRALLAERAERARALVDLVDRTLKALEEDDTMNPEETFEGFDPAPYEEETKAWWGTTEAYAESKRRTSRYTKDDWKKMAAESRATVEELAQAMDDGVAPTDARAMDLAEAHRAHLERWFYACPPAMHVGLGEMYVADPRFAAVYDERRAGLAEFLRAAIHANAARVKG
jgi:MerR family transcriptional regulator, thiopeptide resistance regulator